MQHVSPRARTLFTACFVVGGALLVGAPAGSGGAGWVSVFPAAAAGAAVCAVLGELGRRVPGRDFFGAVSEVCGAGLGTVFTIAIALLALAMLVRDIAVITQFVSANMIAKTPRWLIALSFAAVAAWCAAEGRSTVGRWTELAAAFAGGALVLSFVLAVGDFDAGAVTDGLRSGTECILPGATGLFAGCTGAVLLLGAVLFPFDAAQRRPSLPLIAGLVIGSAALAVILLFNVALLGADTLGLFNFPTYHALRIGGAGGLLERMETLLIFPAMATAFLRAAAEISVLRAAVERFKPSLAGSRPPAFFIAAVGAAMSLGFLHSQIELVEVEAACAVWYAAVLAALTVLLLGATLLHRR